MKISSLMDYVLILVVLIMLFLAWLGNISTLPKEKCNDLIERSHPVRTLKLPTMTTYLITIKKGEAVPYDGWLITNVKPGGN